MKADTLAVATILAVPGSTNSRDRKWDSKMSSTEKSENWHSGMEPNIDWGPKSGLVNTVRTMVETVHES